MHRLITIFVVVLLAVFIYAHPVPAKTNKDDVIHGTEQFFSLKTPVDHSTIIQCQSNILKNLCKPCIKVLEPLNDFWAKNSTEQCIAAILTDICILFKIEDADVCRGIISTYKDDLHYIVSQSVGSPRGVCNLLLDHQCGDTNGDWTVRLPKAKPPVVPLDPIPENVPKLRLLHLADIHVDPWYKVGSMATDCGEPMCCRKNPKGNFTGKLAGKWGHPLSTCDLPQETLDHLMNHIATNHKDIDAIIWTGDLEPHDLWADNRDKTVTALEKLTKLLLKYFPKTPVFPAVGNHEGIPPNLFSPNEAPARFSHDWLTETLKKQWQPFLSNGTDLVDSIIRASYMVNPWKGLRIISINTQYSYTLNYWLAINQNDPDGILSWFVEQLAYAEKAGDKVWVIGHIPPGSGDVHGYYSRNFNDIVNRFESTIRGQFFGHTHIDQFMVFYDNHDPSTGRPTSMLYVAPSVTTFAYNNPGYRIYNLDVGRKEQTWTVTDVVTYWTDLAETLNGDPPKWKLEYNTKEAYKMDQLFPQDWHDLTTRMLEDDTYELIDTYNKNLYRSRDYNSCALSQCASNCDGCRNQTVCYMRRADVNIDSCDLAGDSSHVPLDVDYKFSDDAIKRMKLACFKK